MAITVSELLDSRSYETSEDEPRWTRTFRAYTDPDTDTLTADQAAAQSGIPQPGEAHPDNPQMRVAGVPQITQVPGTKNHWQLEFRYEPRGGFDLGEPPQRDEIGFIEVRVTIKAGFIDKWRVGYSAIPDIQQPSRTLDIGGIKIDSAGKPLSVLHPTVQIQLTQVTTDVNLARIFPFVGSRNFSNFLGINRGLVVYLGVDAAVRLNSGRYRLTHSLVADPDAHLRQQAQLKPTGTPYLTQDSASNWRATTVFVVQPFPNETEFGNPDLGQFL